MNLARVTTKTIGKTVVLESSLAALSIVKWGGWPEVRSVKRSTGDGTEDGTSTARKQLSSKIWLPLAKLSAFYYAFDEHESEVYEFDPPPGSAAFVAIPTPTSCCIRCDTNPGGDTYAGGDTTDV